MKDLKDKKDKSSCQNYISNINIPKSVYIIQKKYLEAKAKNTNKN